jgi:capsular polysaccharide biosynthesis protein
MEIGAEFHFRAVARGLTIVTCKPDRPRGVLWPMGLRKPPSNEAVTQPWQASTGCCDVCHKRLCGWSQMKSRCRAKLLPARS